MSEDDLNLTIKNLKQYSNDIKERVFKWFCDLPQDVAEKLPGFSSSKISPLHIKLREKHIQAKIKQAEGLLKKKNNSSVLNSDESSLNYSFSTLNQLIGKDKGINSVYENYDNSFAETKSQNSDCFIMSSQTLDDDVTNSSFGGKSFNRSFESVDKLLVGNDHRSKLDDSLGKIKSNELSKSSPNMKFVPKTPKYTLNKSGNNFESRDNSPLSYCESVKNSVSNTVKDLCSNSTVTGNKHNSVISINSSNNSTDIINISSTNSSVSHNKNSVGLFTPKENRTDVLLDKLKPLENKFESVSSFINSMSSCDKSSEKRKISSFHSPANSKNCSTPKTNTFNKSLPPLFSFSAGSSPPSLPRGGESFCGSYSPGSSNENNYNAGNLFFFKF